MDSPTGIQVYFAVQHMRWQGAHLGCDFKALSLLPFDSVDRIAPSP
jgi:hypothetical protein